MSTMVHTGKHHRLSLPTVCLQYRQLTLDHQRLQNLTQSWDLCIPRHSYQWYSGVSLSICIS